MKMLSLQKATFPFFSSLFILSTTTSVEARLLAMQESEMSDVVGQSMLELSQHQYTGPNNGQFTSMRITFDGEIAINANIKKLQLGNHPKIANPSGENACQNAQAGCDYLAPDPYTYMCYFDKCQDVDNATIVLGDHNPNGYDFNISGLSLGHTDNGVMRYFHMLRPYFELIFKGDGANKEFVGFRMGVGPEGRVNGYMGMDTIDMFSGQLIANLSDGNLSNFNAYSKNSPLRMRFYAGNVAVPKFLQYLLIPDGFKSIEGMQFDNIPNFYFSFQTHTINYGGNSDHIAPAPPGFWMYASQKEIGNSSINIDKNGYNNNF